MDQRVIIRAKKSAGFTLTELLVVMLILALTASVVVLNIAPPSNKAKDAADIFAAKLNAAAEQAIMTGSLIGLEYDENGYAFYLYDRGAWKESDDFRLGAAAFPGDVSVAFTQTEPAKKNEQTDDKPRDNDAPAPTVFFTPTGETTALIAEFKTRRGDMSVTLDRAGNIKAARNGS